MAGGHGRGRWSVAWPGGRAVAVAVAGGRWPVAGGRAIGRGRGNPAVAVAGGRWPCPWPGRGRGRGGRQLKKAIVPLGAEDFQKHRNIHGLSEDYTTTKSSFTRDLVGWHFSGFSLSDSGVVFVPCIAGTKAGLRAEISFGKFAMDQGFILAFTIYV